MQKFYPVISYILFLLQASALCRNKKEPIGIPAKAVFFSTCQVSYIVVNYFLPCDWQYIVFEIESSQIEREHLIPLCPKHLFDFVRDVWKFLYFFTVEMA